MSIFFHEELYRSPERMERLRRFPVTICGAGALGANIIESLARAGISKLRLIDRDRVEERNLSTQPYQRGDIGAFKAKIMANMLYRAVSAEVKAEATELNKDNVIKLLDQSALVVDTFDNSVGRRAVQEWCSQTATPCLHVGMAGGYAEVIWNERYRVPSAQNDDVCDYPLARNLVTLAVAVACEAIIRFIAGGERQSYTITLEDFAVQPYRD
jgi:molybdopterin/thiamine biosynthesis adenylyltransferase